MKTPLKKAGAVFDRTIDVLAVLAAILAIFLMAITCVDLVLRYFLGGGILGLLEIRGYALTFLVFLGTTWLLKHEGHVKIDLVLSHLSPSAQSLLNIITSAFGTLTCLIICWYSVTVTWGLFQKGTHIVSLLLPLEWPFKAVIAVSFFLLSVQFIRRTYGYMRSRRELS